MLGKVRGSGRATVNLTLTDGANQTVDLSAYTDPADITITLTTGKTIWSTDPANPALIITGTVPSTTTVTFVNNGSVLGRGGYGGSGAAFDGSNGSSGGAGGHALKHDINVAMTINNLNGYIFGGGGGGGGGAAGGIFTVFSWCAGGGGGGGQGYLGGSLGAAGGENPNGSAGQTPPSDGYDGSYADRGTYGVGETRPVYGTSGGNGGFGGYWGSAGIAGSSADSGSGGSGGSAGKAVYRTGSGSVSFSAGNNSSQVKGVVD